MTDKDRHTGRVGLWNIGKHPEAAWIGHRSRDHPCRDTRFHKLASLLRACSKIKRFLACENIVRLVANGKMLVHIQKILTQIFFD
ncbi:MAG: hypothetical protein MASP_00408 [Candidatus Methanolliviera sp. GoM_asphalt]|nr:MAG: hypothetical protein MASP_00408 [Candidatus Methanolliviera sp. GoM_asphalt]